MANIPYSRVEEELKALAGVDDLSATEKAFIRSSVNRRANIAYEESNYWAPFLVSEFRYAGIDNTLEVGGYGFYNIDTLLDICSQNPRIRNSSCIRYETVRDSAGWKILGLDDVDYLSPVYTIESGSTFTNTSEATFSGNFRSISFWMTIDSPVALTGDILEFPVASVNVGGLWSSIYWTSENGVGAFAHNIDIDIPLLVYVDGALVGQMGYQSEKEFSCANIFDDGLPHLVVITMSPNDSTVVPISGIAAPAPGLYTVSMFSGDTVEASDIRLYSTSFNSGDASAYFNNPERNYGALVWTSSLPRYWCLYRRELVETYGTNSGDTTFIPSEFFAYCVHGAYADWLRSEDQHEKAMLEEQFARDHLDRQLLKIHYNSQSPSMWTRANNHSTRQNR